MSTTLLNEKQNSVDPDQTPRFAASDQGLHCLLKPVFSVNILNYYGIPRQPKSLPPNIKWHALEKVRKP